MVAAHGDTKFMFKCQQCDREFTYKAQLITHAKQQHGGLGTKGGAATLDLVVQALDEGQEEEQIQSEVDTQQRQQTVHKSMPKCSVIKEVKGGSDQRTMKRSNEQSVQADGKTVFTEGNEWGVAELHLV